MAFLKPEMAALCAAFVSCCTASFLLNGIIQTLHDRFLESLSKQSSYISLAEEKDRTKIKAGLHLDMGAKIGNIERILYIYSVVISKYEIIGGWLILKTFWGWIGQIPMGTSKGASSNVSDADDYDPKNRQHELLTYYLYTYGNGLSLLFGILLGLIVPLFANFLLPCFLPTP